MGRGATLVYDTEPLSFDISLIADYTSLHLYSAVSAQLFRWSSAAGDVIAAACKSATCLEDGRVHRFTLASGLFWKERTPVSPRDFVRRFEDLFARRAPIAWRFAHVRDVSAGVNSAGEEDIVFQLTAPDPRFRNKLAHPSTGPLSPAGSEGQFPFAAGPFRFGALDSSGGTLEPANENGSARPSPGCLNFRFTADPNEAIRMYDAGAVDATCPANFPLGRVAEFAGRPDFHQCQATTFLVLAPSSARGGCKAWKRLLADCINADRINEISPTGIGRMEGFVDRTTALGRRDRPSGAPPPRLVEPPLRLACDQFQPNPQVLAIIADELRNKGAPVETVVDDYARPAAPCDYRLIVMVNSLAYPADAYRRIAAADAFRDDPGISREMWEAIEQFDRAEDASNRTSALRRLDHILWRELPVIPVAVLRQFGLKRSCLDAFSWDSDDSWRRI